MPEKLYSSTFKISNTAVIISTDDEMLHNGIRNWLNTFNADFHEYEDAVKIKILGLHKSNTMPIPIPENARCIYEGHTARYLTNNHIWYFEIPEIGRMAIDLNNKEINACAYVENIFSEAWHLQDFMHPLFELLRMEELYLFHSGAVCIDNWGLMLAGRSGRGKSTLSLHLLANGFSFMSDDRCFIERTKTGYDLTGFLEPVKFWPQNVKHITSINNIEQSGQNDKTVIDIKDYFPYSISKKCTLKAIIFPRWCPGKSSRLEAIKPAKAIVEILPLTMECLFSNTSKKHFEFNCELVERLPMAILTLGKDKSVWHKLIRSFLVNGVVQ